MTTTHVRIFYPADPVGVVPGGIDTFFRGLIKWAPEGLEFSLVGMTTDPQARPVGRWTQCRLGDRTFNFFPVVHVANAGSRSRIPLSVRYCVNVWRHLSTLHTGFDVFDFHRPEPCLLFTADGRPKNMYFHQDPTFVRLDNSDNLWKHLPRLYERLERKAMQSIRSAWCVRGSGVQTLRQRYPTKAENIQFIPTWVDPEIFYPVGASVRQALRSCMAASYQIEEKAKWIVTVGRLDTQKDPLLMLAAFSRLCKLGNCVSWLIVGDGVLRSPLERAVTASGFGNRVHFLGLQPPAAIADVLRAADVYALSSAYEGMPMALLEALGCGLAVVTTDVGEVRRVVTPGINGAIAAERDEESLAAALATVLASTETMGGSPACSAVDAYQPAKVLQAAYENYSNMGSANARMRHAAAVAHAGDTPDRMRRSVVGVPIDLQNCAQASQRLIAWAQAGTSRTVCFVNVHSAVHASHDELHRQALLGADMVVPDGAPIALTLRIKGHKQQRRVDGPDMMLRLCADAQSAGVKIGLFGSTPETLRLLQIELQRLFPALVLGYVHSPPFRELTQVEDQQICADVSESGVGLLFVGMGCPKQEYWIACHRGRIPAVMLGVGAAFEFHAGTVVRAPQWMRENGLEWLHRLLSEPQRLWRRYLFSNSLFLSMSAREAIVRSTKRVWPFKS